MLDKLNNHKVSELVAADLEEMISPEALFPHGLGTIIHCDNIKATNCFCVPGIKIHNGNISELGFKSLGMCLILPFVSSWKL